MGKGIPLPAATWAAAWKLLFNPRDLRLPSTPEPPQTAAPGWRRNAPGRSTAAIAAIDRRSGPRPLPGFNTAVSELMNFSNGHGGQLEAAARPVAIEA